jgi:hypothetical protein
MGGRGVGRVTREVEVYLGAAITHVVIGVSYRARHVGPPYEADARRVLHYMHRTDHAFSRRRSSLPCGPLSRMSGAYSLEHVHTTFVTVLARRAAGLPDEERGLVLRDNVAALYRGGGS